MSCSKTVFFVLANFKDANVSLVASFALAVHELPEAIRGSDGQWLELVLPSSTVWCDEPEDADVGP